MARKTVIGFVVESDKGYFLGNAMEWLESSLENTFVYPKADLGSIIWRARNWDEKPAKIYPAGWNKVRGVTILGDPVRIEW